MMKGRRGQEDSRVASFACRGRGKPPRRKLAAVLMLAGQLVHPGFACAQSLREAVQTALRTNPVVLAAEDDRHAADDQLRGAKGGYLPRLDIDYGISREQLSSPTSRLLGTADDDFEHREATATLSQILFDGFNTQNLVSRAAAQVDSAAFGVHAIAENVALDTIGAYLEVLRRQETMALAQQNLGAHQGIRETIRKRAAGGLSRRSDFDQADSRYALARASLRQERAALADAQAAFMRLVGAAPQGLRQPAPFSRELPGIWGVANFFVPEREADEKASAAALPQEAETLALPASEAAEQEESLVEAPDLVAYREALQNALERHPAVRAARADVEAARRQIDVARSPYMPRLNLEMIGSHAEDLTRDRTGDVSAGLRLRWNLYSGGSDGAAVGQAGALHDRAMERLREVQRQVTENLAQSVNALFSARDRLAVLRHYAQAITSAQTAYERQFNIGQRSLLDLVNAQDEQYAARTQVVTAAYAERLATYRLFAAMGQLLPVLDLKLPEAAAVDVASAP